MGLSDTKLTTLSRTPSEEKLVVVCCSASLYDKALAKAVEKTEDNRTIPPCRAVGGVLMKAVGALGREANDDDDDDDWKFLGL